MINTSWVLLHYNKHVLGFTPSWSALPGFYSITKNTSWVLLHHNRHFLGFTPSQSTHSGFYSIIINTFWVSLHHNQHVLGFYLIYNNSVLHKITLCFCPKLKEKKLKLSSYKIGIFICIQHIIAQPSMYSCSQKGWYGYSWQ